jgi:hypothetical protein
MIICRGEQRREARKAVAGVSPVEAIEQEAYPKVYPLGNPLGRSPLQVI